MVRSSAMVSVSYPADRSMTAGYGSQLVGVQYVFQYPTQRIVQ